MSRYSLISMAAASLIALAPASRAATVNQGIGYVLGTGGVSLSVIADLSAPVVSAPIFLTENGQLTSLDAIAYRPNTGSFIGYQSATNTVYAVDVMTGALAALVTGTGVDASGQPVETTTPVLDVDFNNSLDAARIVTREGENLVFFPERDAATPARVIRATDLFYEAGDVNQSAIPNVFANAYTNAVPQPVPSTQQFALDSDLNILTTLNNNAGNLATIGQFIVDGMSSPLDFSEVGGFDILSPSFGDNLGIALLTVAGMSNLYSFEIPGVDANGQVIRGDVRATFLGSIGSGFDSFAVAPVAPVPVPASLLLLMGGLGGFAALRRLRKPAA